MDWKFVIFTIVIAIFANAVIFSFFWCGIRSLMKKTLNLAPLSAIWTKVECKPISTHTSEFYDSDNAGVVYNKGIPIITRPMTQRFESVSQVAYEYDGRTYSTTIREDSKHGYGIQLYCKKNDPEKIRHFAPKQPKPISAAISMLLIGAMLIFLEAVLISQLIQN